MMGIVGFCDGIVGGCDGIVRFRDGYSTSNSVWNGLVENSKPLHGISCFRKAFAPD